jgi:esterase/lipase superfamily enzyme
MHVEYHRWFSQALGHDMELKVYGHYGQPVVVFPAQDGRFHDFEGFGMVGACAELIDAGRVKFVTVDGVDWQSWTNQAAHPADRARRHTDYERHIINEVVPFVQHHTRQATMWVSGCSMGALHSANFFFRRPDIFDGVIALSGLYDLTHFVGQYSDEGIYFNAPLHYLPNLNDPWHLERYRRAQIVFAVGQGRWEEDSIRDTRALEGILRAKNIPAWFDYWGFDVDHDWVWWRKMLPHFLHHTLERKS